MKISYNWLLEYLPIDEELLKVTRYPGKIAEIVTSVGLEVEALERYEQVKNGLEGLVIGEVLGCEKHPDADRLKVTTVKVVDNEVLQIVCGAPNVAAGQKVVVAPVGSTLFPIKGEPLIIKKAKIRGVESNGMLCAEDEIGLGPGHDGIMVLGTDAVPGTPAADYFNLYLDWIYEIGLTPNRMDAMSHLGVAKDICAYISHHLKKPVSVISPFRKDFKVDNHSKNIKVEIKDAAICERYAGVSISGIKVAESPDWLKNKLRSIGVRPLNNVVDITNFILHETGQPLHAFDLDRIKGNKIIVQTLPAGTTFITLDEKERKLLKEDVMICNGENEPMCFAGVFGGLDSGVTAGTTDLFLESAVFNPAAVRKTMLHHNLRTDAAVRFEKGIDIGNTVQVLKRTAQMIKEIAGGKIASDILDVYPVPRPKKEISLPDFYLKKISGKNYHRDTVKNILSSLNFTILREGIDSLQVQVPYSNPDITLPADVIEEIMRIDGLDNIEIPSAITIAPSADTGSVAAVIREKIAGWLVGNGFHEIFTNSITNSKYFTEETLATAVLIINSLSEGLNIMRPSMLPAGLETISYNLNRKNNDLLLFEFGKTYSRIGEDYREKPNLSLFITGNQHHPNWHSLAKIADIYYVKGLCDAVFALVGVKGYSFETSTDNDLDECLRVSVKGKEVLVAGAVKRDQLEDFAIRQPVFFAGFDWNNLLTTVGKQDITYVPVSRYPQVQRDLSILVDKSTRYSEIEELVKLLHIKKLQQMQLFDVFESPKLGENKKSFAINFTFQDKEKTMTDEEITQMMNKIIGNLESKVNAVIRSNA